MPMPSMISEEVAEVPELEELENQKVKFYWEFIWIFFLLVKSRVAESTL